VSGIAGILQLDGAPVDRPLLEAMTRTMAFRGPDAQAVWSDGPVGFGHVMLRATDEQAREQQPCSLDGQVWITADARIDGRAELRRELEAAGRDDRLADATDAELILHAYHAWGEACVEHLLGDFAFAVWDGRARKLFCARDHFGVKPFYYAQVAGALIFGNTLNSLRLHPAVSSELNELAIADFLLFNYNQEFDTTTFADIAQLAPAHCLTLSDGALRLRRYWTLPIEETLLYKRPDDYVDRFRELFDQAVGDRLRTERLGIFMSGGLDSTSVAARAVSSRKLLTALDNFDIRAYTFVSGSVDPDGEGQHARLVAEHLNIPITFFADDVSLVPERWDDPEWYTPEPVNRPSYAVRLAALRQAAGHGCVLLGGDGGDPVLYPSYGHFVGLAKDLRFGRMVSDAWGYWRIYGRRPPLYFGTYFRKRIGSRGSQVAYPAWLNRAFVDRLELQARWAQAQRQPPVTHPTRPEAYSDLVSPYWPHKFVNRDPGVSQIRLEMRYPFFDVRLVTFLLRLPPVPWFVHKHLLRSAMRGILPEAVRTRPKASFPFVEEDLPAREKALTWSRDLAKTPAIAAWVDVEEYRRLADQLPHVDPQAADSMYRPASLARWLWADRHAVFHHLSQLQPGGSNEEPQDVQQAASQEVR